MKEEKDYKAPEYSEDILSSLIDIIADLVSGIDL